MLLWVLFQFTKLGLAMRAAALRPRGRALVGVRVNWMLAIGWGLAAVLGAVAGLMTEPTVFLQPTMMQAVLLYAFAAAVLGGLESPAGAVIGGLLLGVFLNLVGQYVGFATSELRLPIAFAVLLVVLLVKPTGLFGREAGEAGMKRSAAGLVACVVIGAVVLALLPFQLSGYHTGLGAHVAIFFIAILGLNILTGYTGQISIGHGAFMAIGGYTTAVMSHYHHTNLILTLPLAFAIAFGFGVARRHPGAALLRRLPRARDVRPRRLGARSSR